MATFTVSYNPNIVAKLVTGAFATKTVTADQMEVNVDGSVVFQTYFPNASPAGYYTVDILNSGSYVEVTQN